MEKTNKVREATARKEPDNTLDLLLNMDIQAPRTEKVKMKRLSSICGQDVVFTIKQLSYNRVNEIIEQYRFDTDMSVFIMLAGTVSPKLKDKNLLDKYEAVTPAELLKKLLLPGEIEDISREIQRLCGYRQNTFEIVDDVKKK